jgi:uncharacterized glyoxalase superfamily protein PhnB
MPKLTPILFVDAVEPSLPFWVDGLGFEKTAEVPGDGGLVFAILNRGACEVMLQTWASMAADHPELAREKGRSCVYLEVDDVHAAAARMAAEPVLLPMRDMFYGMTEITLREPGGHTVILAAKTK